MDLYQIHSATFASGVLTNTAVLDALACLKADGVRIGLLAERPDQGAVLAAALVVTVDGVRLLRQRAGHVESAGTVDGTGVGRGGRCRAASSSRRRWPTDV
ncbi:MAG: hypothetical protein R3A10_12725 [Caldilineaceae bacterium]